MKLAEYCRKPMTWIASRVEDLMDALLRSGRRFSKSCATSATSTALATAVVTAEIEMTTGVVTGMTATTVTIAITIGGDEFQSLGINPHLTSACYLLVYLPEGLGSKAGAFIFPVKWLHARHPVSLRHSDRQSRRHHAPRASGSQRRRSHRLRRHAPHTQAPQSLRRKH